MFRLLAALQLSSSHLIRQPQVPTSSMGRIFGSVRAASCLVVLVLLLQGVQCRYASYQHGSRRHQSRQRRFHLEKHSRAMLQDTAAMDAGMTDEEMEAMLEENWPPLPPSPPPDSPPGMASSDSEEELVQGVAALAAKPKWKKQRPPRPPRPPKPPGKWAKKGKRPPSPPSPDPTTVTTSTPVNAVTGDESGDDDNNNDGGLGEYTSQEETSSFAEAPDPQVVGDFEQVGIGYIVAVHMVLIPGTNRFLFMERPSGKHPDRGWAIAGVWDQDKQMFFNVNATDSLFCSGHTVTTEGDILVVGGHIAKSGYKDGLKGLRIFNSTTNTLERVGDLLAPRWYPTATLLPNGWVFIVGGTIKPGSGTGITPYYELWDPANPGVTVRKDLSKEFVDKAFDIYYPNNYILPNGKLFMYCNTYGEIIDPMEGTTHAVIPYLGDKMRIHTEYPYTGTSVMLPLYPENAYGVEVVYFGGQYNYGWVNTTASNMAFRLQLTIMNDGTYDFNNGWYPEEMLSPRVMPDAVLLPNGQIVLLNGAHKGLAGDNIKGGRAKANDPNFFPELYTPNAMYGQRFTPLKRNLIPRMYHSTAALTEDGTVLVAGCDRCANFWSDDPKMSKSPWGLPEYRVELLRPPVWFDFTSKPVITWSSSATLYYDQPLSLVYHMFDMTMISDRAVIVAPSSTTHSTNMHQRVVGLRITRNDAVEDSYNMTVLGPEHANLAPPGKYMLFLLNGNVYGRSIWLHLKHGPSNTLTRRHHHSSRRLHQ